MSYNNLTYEIENRINIISINRPEKLNALNIETFSEIDHAIKSSVANDEVRIIILTGVGEKEFVAGADIKEFADFSIEKGKNLSADGHAKLFDLVENLNTPVIAAINGFALGGGLELAMSAHIRVASNNATLLPSEVNLTAQFTAREVLPTPPLPLAIAIDRTIT